MAARTLFALCVSFCMIAMSSIAAADPGGEGSVTGPPDPIVGLITDDDLFALADLSTLLPASDAQPTQHYGPYASSSPDSGTCANDWAEDTFDRVFTVRQTGPTSFTVVEQFKNGAFTTNDGPSPGACQLDDGSTTTLVTAGLAGTMHGYLIIDVAGTQTSSDESCIAGSPAAECTTAGFIVSHFAGPYTTPTYFFHYAGYDGSNQALIAHEWKNASDDRGGNHGDIATE